MGRILLLLSLIVWLSVSSVFAGIGVDYDDANCQGAWLFTEGSGTTVADDSQNTNTGNFKDTGEPAWASMAGTNAPSYSDYMVDFDGSNDFIDCGTDSSLDPGTDDFTFIQWVRSNDTDCFSLSTRSSSTTDGYEFLIGGGATAGDWSMRVDGAVGSSYSPVVSGLNDGKWHFLCGTLTYEVSPYGKFWVDGVDEVDIERNPGAITNSQNFYFGRRGTLFGFSDYSGESAVFNRDLDSTEINDIMDNGLAGAVAPPTRRVMLISSAK